MTDLHHRAMDLADEGDRLRRAGQLDEARSAYARAFELEREAALATDAEPSRGILLRSARCLAADAGLAWAPVDARGEGR